MRDEGSAPGVQGAVLVACGDAVIHEAFRGVADHATGAEVTDQTRFQVASVSKQFAATAVLLLCEEGKLSPADRVGAWFRKFGRHWDLISVHHLLTHTSGLGHWPDYADLATRAWTTSTQLVEALAQTPLQRPPGGGWHYSSPGYVLLAQIVECVSEVPYPEFVRRRIFEPLGMEHTFVGDPAHRQELARGYLGADVVEYRDIGVLYAGAGDMWSTAQDLLQWNRALAAGEVLTQGSLDLMFTPHVRTGPSQDHYGYGWMIGSLAGQRARYHVGDNPGFRAINACLVDRDYGLIVLSNQELVDLAEVTTRLVGAFCPTAR